MHVVDAGAEFVETLAAEFGEQLVELDGQMFELPIEPLKTVVRLRGDDRADRFDDLPDILAAGALRGADRESLDTLRQIKQPGFQFLQRERPRRERAQQFLDLAGLASKFVQSRRVGLAWRLQFVQPARDGAQIFAQISHQRSWIEILHHRPQFAGDAFRRRERGVIHAAVALRVDAPREIAKSGFDRRDRGARREIAQRAGKIFDLLAQILDLPNNDILLIGALGDVAAHAFHQTRQSLHLSAQIVEAARNGGMFAA